MCHYFHSDLQPVKYTVERLSLTSFPSADQGTVLTLKIYLHLRLTESSSPTKEDTIKSAAHLFLKNETRGLQDCTPWLAILYSCRSLDESWSSRQELGVCQGPKDWWMSWPRGSCSPELSSSSSSKPKTSSSPSSKPKTSSSLAGARA